MAVAIGLATGIARAQSAAPATPATEEGITEPWTRATLSPHNGGIVREVPVREGDVVKQGQVILQQDDRMEERLRHALEVEAASNARIEFSEADLKVKQVDFKRKESLLKKGSGSVAEFEEAQLSLVAAERQLALAQLEKEKALAEFERQDIKVKLMELVAPFDGVIERIEASPGEVIEPTSNERGAAIVLVQNNPLKVVFHPKTWKAARLKKGDKLQVRYQNDADEQWATGEVIFLSPVADASSDTREVHLSLPNDALRNSGERVVVKLPELVETSPAADAAR